jgi:hypothetical protein
MPWGSWPPPSRAPSKPQLRWPSWFAEAWKPPDHPIRLLVESKITAGSSLVHPEAVIRQLAF